jgi:hypothetical protein
MLTTFLRNFTVRNCQEIQDGFDLLRHDNPNAGYKQDSRDSVRSLVRSFENVFILATILIRKTKKGERRGNFRSCNNKSKCDRRQSESNRREIRRRHSQVLLHQELDANRAGLKQNNCRFSESKNNPGTIPKRCKKKLGRILPVEVSVEVRGTCFLLFEQTYRAILEHMRMPRGR